VGSKRACCVLVSVAALAAALSPPAQARRTFKPRVGRAMGIVPALGRQEIAAAEAIPVLFHGGTVMHHPTVHTIFWAPAGYTFSGSPAPGVPGYEQLVEQFFSDVAHDSGATGNVFSVLPQYGDGAAPGSYSVAYDPASDSIDDADPYPARPRCASPAGVATCLTDLQLQQEIARVIRSRPHGPGDAWMLFLPPDVDTCVQVGQCGTNVFAGYHSLSNQGLGATVYAVIPDPLIELTPPPGSDPEGNPEAEAAIDVAAHEAVESITDPEGTGWMDPNGFEVGDECETQTGTPLGTAGPDHAPYNQLIGGHPYLVQTMWSNAVLGCRQSSAATTSPLPLASVSLRQFSPFVRGAIGRRAGGVPVTILLARAGTVVGGVSTRTRADGSWGPAPLQPLTRRRALAAVGDDRDELLVRYGPGGPPPDLIETGDGGNPFTEAGWTGWFDLDNGYAIGRSSILLAPCGQTGVLGVTVGGAPTAPPVEQCETESDVAVLGTGPLRLGTPIAISSEDNRAVSIENPNGALVTLTIAAGEPRSVSALGNGQILLQPTGFPSCTADLRAQSVRCSGLEPHARYSLTRRRRHAVRRTRANAHGVLTVAGLRRGIAGGDVLTLRNAAGRRLTELHVAHLRVDIKGEQTVLAGGRCEPGEYWGPPPAAPPLSVSAGLPGLGGTGTICPPSGRARGLPAADIAQTDDAGGGQTRVRVPLITGIAPLDDATLYGGFILLAQSGLPGPHGSIAHVRATIAVTITRAGRTVFRAANVERPGGVLVHRLPRGVYGATWVLSDANGDTRTVRTRFVEVR
jgi:hypothetical protein